MERIQTGDKVSVFFNTADSIHNAEVLKTPCATGDCFVLKDTNGAIINVQQYNYMVKENTGR